MVRRAVPFALIRVFLLSLVAVMGSGYALVRYYTRPHLPMVVPAPAETATGTEANPSDAGEIPAPELIPYEEPRK